MIPAPKATRKPQSRLPKRISLVHFCAGLNGRDAGFPVNSKGLEKGLEVQESLILNCHSGPGIGTKYYAAGLFIRR